MKYPVFCKVHLVWYNDDEHKTETQDKVILLYANNFADAARQLDEYYSDELEKIEIQLFAEGLLEFPMELAESIHKTMEEYI